MHRHCKRLCKDDLLIWCIKCFCPRLLQFCSLFITQLTCSNPMKSINLLHLYKLITCRHLNTSADVTNLVFFYTHSWLSSHSTLTNRSLQRPTTEVICVTTQTTSNQLVTCYSDSRENFYIILFAARKLFVLTLGTPLSPTTILAYIGTDAK